VRVWKQFCRQFCRWLRGATGVQDALWMLVAVGVALLAYAVCIASIK